MSLARAALRIAVVNALRGRTLVGDNVLDSKIGVIEVGADGGAMTDQNKPFVAVYTASSATDVSELRALTGNGETVLVFELGATAKMAVIDEETERQEIVPGIPPTDDALELMLDLAVREIGTVLTDPSNAWAEVYRGLVNRVTKIEVEPLRSDAGQRLAARQVRITLDLIADPVFGVAAPEDTALGPFLRQLDRTPGTVAARQAKMIRLAAGSAGAPDWEILQRRKGMTSRELRDLGFGPVEQDVDRTAPVFTGAVHQVRRLDLP